MVPIDPSFFPRDSGRALMRGHVRPERAVLSEVKVNECPDSLAVGGSCHLASGQLSRLAAATMIPVTDAAMQESSKTSCRSALILGCLVRKLPLSAALGHVTTLAKRWRLLAVHISTIPYERAGALLSN